MPLLCQIEIRPVRFCENSLPIVTLVDSLLVIESQVATFELLVPVSISSDLTCPIRFIIIKFNFAYQLRFGLVRFGPVRSGTGSIIALVRIANGSDF